MTKFVWFAISIRHSGLVRQVLGALWIFFSRLKLVKILKELIASGPAKVSYAKYGKV